MEQIIIIGAGLAGLAAACTAAKKGRPCVLVSPQPSERTQSVLAEGGISAVVDVENTMEAGAFLADSNAVQRMADAAPEIIDWLQGLGVPFASDGGMLSLRRMGGHYRANAAYAQNSIGKAIMAAMIDEARKYEAEGLIERLSHHAFVQLLLADGVCAGCVVRDTYSDSLLNLCGSVILTSGGLSGLFGEYATGTVQNTGKVTAVVFRQGVTLANLEFIQYHPTTISTPGKRLLVTEAARSEGGRLFVLRDGEPWYFMEEKYPALGNLMPRDVVAQEMAALSQQTGCEGIIYLDLTAVPAETWQDRLADLKLLCSQTLHLDPQKEPVPVMPGIHYFMGGILVDTEHQTNIRHLYAAGECACQYHGANRLGGNSLLGALHGGITAAKQAVAEGIPGENLFCTDVPSCDIANCLTSGEQRKVSSILANGLGIIRTEEAITKAIGQLSEIRLANNCCDELLLADAMLRSALERRESRGAHFRADFPQMDDTYRKITAATIDRDGVHINFLDIPAEWRAAQ